MDPAGTASRRLRSNQIVAGLALAAAIAGAASGVHPTGWAPVDRAYGAVLAGLATVAASRTSRGARLVFAAVVVGASRGWLLLPAVADLGLAFGTLWVHRWRQRLAAAVGAVGAPVVLHWPPLGFHGLTALLAAVAFGVLAASGWWGVPRRQRRLLVLGAGGAVVLAAVLSAPVVIGGVIARHRVGEGVAATSYAIGRLDAGDRVGAERDLRQASADFATAHRDTGSWWTAGARLVPVAAEQRQALAVATAAAGQLTGSAATATTTIDDTRLRSPAGAVDLATLEAEAPVATRLDADLHRATGSVAGVRSPWLVEPIRTRLGALSTQLASARRRADLVAAALQAAPDLLGGHGARTYLVAFMTPAESRGLDGYIGAYATLRADDGQLSLSAQGPISAVPTPPGGRQLVAPASYRARYGGFLPQANLGDVPYAPDLPTDASILRSLYAQSTGTAVDGVIALDPEGLAALLTLTGPVPVPGLPEPLTSANAADALDRQQYTALEPVGGPPTARHDELQDALAQTFPRLLDGSLPGPAALWSEVGPAVRDGHLSVWSADPANEDPLHRLGAAGAWPDRGDGDLLAVTADNAANNKVDAYLHRTIDDRVTWDPGSGTTTDQVTVTLHNTAPAEGLPPEVIGSYPGSGLPPGADRSWLTIYSPLRVTAETVDGSPVDPVTLPELSVNAASSYVTVPAGGTVTVRVTLSGRLAPSPTYRLVVRRQPMVVPDSETIEVGAAPGWSGGDRCTPGPSAAAACDARFRHSR